VFNRQWNPQTVLVLSLVLLTLRPAGRCAQVQVTPSADTTLVETAPDNNLGGACILNVGTAHTGTRNRGLFQFDLTGVLPENAVVTRTELVLSVTGESVNGVIPASFSLHRMLRAWGEGNKGDPNCPPESGNSPGVGVFASQNEATWNHRFAMTPNTWGAPGGAEGIDFAAGSSAETGVSGTGDSPYHFTDSAAMDADVQFWMSNPRSNFGWMLICDTEEDVGTARRFGSHEDPFNAPVLLVDYTVVPEPGTLTLFGLISAFLGFVRCRRQP
jgi:hypothetical protein